MSLAMPPCRNGLAGDGAWHPAATARVDPRRRTRPARLHRVQSKRFPLHASTPATVRRNARFQCPYSPQQAQSAHRPTKSNGGSNRGTKGVKQACCGWNGMGRNATARHGTARHGTACPARHGMGRDGTARDGTGWDERGRPQDAILAASGAFGFGTAVRGWHDRAALSPFFQSACRVADAKRAHAHTRRHCTYSRARTPFSLHPVQRVRAALRTCTHARTHRDARTLPH